MKGITPAQALLMRLGVSLIPSRVAGEPKRSASHTKKGPGRYHKQGKKKQ